MRSPYKSGIMDAVFLRQEVDELGIENSRRPPDAPRDDLLATADELERDALALGVPELLAGVHLRRADILQSLGRYGDSLVPLKQVRAVLGSLRTDDLQPMALAKQAYALSKLGDWENVSKVCEEGIDLVEKFRFKVAPQYHQSSYLRFRISLYTLGVRAAMELGLYEVALHRAELAKCRSLLRYRRSSGPVSLPANGQTESEFRKLCDQIDTAQRAGRPIPEAVLARRRALWDLLSIERFQSRQSDDVPEFSLEAVQSSLGLNDAILYYFWLDEGTLLLATLDRTGLMTEMRPVSATDRQALVEYAKPDSGIGRGRVRKFTSLLLPKDDRLLKDKTRLFVSPHRVLHGIPFHALSFDGGFLIEKLAVVYTPNLSALLLDVPKKRTSKVLGLGISQFDIIPPLNPLEDAQREVEDLKAGYVPNGIAIDTLLGPDAREENLQKLEATLGQYTYLHFATHGCNIIADSPMESYLFLVDSKLEAIEIANWRLEADLVVLSACSSGQRAISGRGMSELPGDDLLGLQAAFFAAGASAVLCTLWPVNSEAARIIMTSVHKLLSNGMARDFAVQSAIKEFLSDKFNRDIDLWAPFFLASIGRPRS